MSKAVFLRPHNIYPDYEGDWIQVKSKVQGKTYSFVNAASHKSLNSSIQGIDNESSRKTQIDNLEGKKIVKINTATYYPLDLFKGSLLR